MCMQGYNYYAYIMHPKAHNSTRALNWLHMVECNFLITIYVCSEVQNLMIMYLKCSLLFVLLFLFNRN